MLTIDKIITAIHNNRIRISDHAYEEAYNDRLSFEEIFTSVLQGGIIEKYPKDKPFQSCLVYGMNMKREPVHSVWGFNHENKWAVLITVYRPDPTKWIDMRIRRKKDDAI